MDKFRVEKVESILFVFKNFKCFSKDRKDIVLFNFVFFFMFNRSKINVIFRRFWILIILGK